MTDKWMDRLLDFMAVILVFMMIWIVTDAFAYDKDAREKRRANERQYQSCVSQCSMTCPGVMK